MVFLEGSYDLFLAPVHTYLFYLETDHCSPERPQTRLFKMLFFFPDKIGDFGKRRRNMCGQEP